VGLLRRERERETIDYEHFALHAPIQWAIQGYTTRLVLPPLSRIVGQVKTYIRIGSENTTRLVHPPLSRIVGQVKTHIRIGNEKEGLGVDARGTSSAMTPGCVAATHVAEGVMSSQGG